MHSTAEDGPIVDAAWVRARPADADVRVVEIDVSNAAYEAGHVPGAMLWNAYTDLRDSEYLPVPAAALEALLSRAGVTPESTLVFCGYGDALGYWLMRAHGHERVRMLAGSREEWARELGPLSVEAPTPSASTYALGAADPELLATRATVEAALADPGSVLLDVRSELEYAGERFWPSGATADTGRAGHLPGAISVPIELLRNPDGTLKAPEELRSVLQEAGVSGETKVITYCTIGNRASQAAYALKLLGYPDVSVYYPSWVEWGKAPDTPVET